MLTLPDNPCIEKIEHGKPLLLLGSCFSDEIGQCLQQNGFAAQVNPGGTLFHPLAIAKLLNWALDDKQTLRTFPRADVWLSWDLAGSVYAMSEAALLEKLTQLKTQLRKALLESSHLLLTFGSAWAYRLNEDQSLVANCHKQPSQFFSKEQTMVQTIVDTWKALIDLIKQHNPTISIVFTVSPVRHAKDGLHENNLSKAKLLLAIEALVEVTNCAYFPAYELVLDQLRDYSFFKEDGVHPNEKATAHVWDYFKRNFCSDQTQQILKEWEALQLALQHKLLYPESQEAQQHNARLGQMKIAFKEKYPEFTATQL
jgi:hypothetical protein